MLKWIDLVVQYGPRRDDAFAGDLCLSNHSDSASNCELNGVGDCLTLKDKQKLPVVSYR